MILLREECEESNKKKKKSEKIIKRKKVEDLGKLEKQGTRNLELKRRKTRNTLKIRKI